MKIGPHHEGDEEQRDQPGDDEGVEVLADHRARRRLAAVCTPPGCAPTDDVPPALRTATAVRGWMLIATRTIAKTAMSASSSSGVTSGPRYFAVLLSALAPLRSTLRSLMRAALPTRSLR